MLRTYELTKFKRSNAGTCTNQRPIVNKGERIEANQIIGDGPATSNGELSLGKNALIGFILKSMRQKPEIQSSDLRRSQEISLTLVRTLLRIWTRTVSSE